MRSQEIGEYIAGLYAFCRFWDFLKSDKLLVHIFFDFENSCDVATAIAVIGSRPNCDKISIWKPELIPEIV